MSSRRCFNFSLEFQLKLFIIFCIIFVGVVNSNSLCKDKKNCDEYESEGKDEERKLNIEDVESRVSRLERRLRAMEQPGISLIMIIIIMNSCII